MAHIEYTRQVDRRRSLRLDHVMPLDMGGCNFAAFGGSTVQRTAVALQAAARYCGVCGVVVLIDASSAGVQDPLEEAMLRLPASLPQSHDRYRQTPATTIPWREYDMLYGLDEASIEALLFPEADVLGRSDAGNYVIGGTLAYLRIMESEYLADATDFGRYPYGLDLLLELTALPYEVLERRVLRYLPDDLRGEVVPLLNKPDVQHGVHTAVKRFANKFRRFGVTPRPFLKHTRRSIISAVSRREVVCIRVPDSSGVLLDYIETELAQLTAQGTQYLLISAGLDLNQSPRLRDRFLSERSGNYYTGILAGSMRGVADTQLQQEQVFSRYPQILVFQCATEGLAEPFSANCGAYKHLEVHFSEHRHREPLHILSGVGVGRDVVPISERNVRPEELTKLGNGVLLCGKQYTIPVLVGDLRSNGGDLNGVYLQQMPSGGV